MITVIYVMHGFEYDKTYVVWCILILIVILIALYERINYIIGKCDIPCEWKATCFYMNVCKGFHVIWWWHALYDSLQWRSPRLAYRGSAVDQFITHIRSPVENLNEMNVNWDTQGRHTGFSGANVKGKLSSLSMRHLKLTLAGSNPSCGHN